MQRSELMPQKSPHSPCVRFLTRNRESIRFYFDSHCTALMSKSADKEYFHYFRRGRWKNMIVWKINVNKSFANHNSADNDDKITGAKNIVRIVPIDPATVCQPS